MDNVGFIDPEFVEDDSLSPHWILLNHLVYGVWRRPVESLPALLGGFQHVSTLKKQRMEIIISGSQV
jgi:hypothetical protein